ncbi:MAG TPA: efflux RND transporter periplasmic adaptor subunit [Vicinamibacterales bacterium]|nr:efflux RND transporter periplasmic adaptor subunit [Vicinamibacterales bacterium]
MPRHIISAVALVCCCLAASACGKAENPSVDATGGAKGGTGAGRGGGRGGGGGGPIPVTTAVVQKKSIPVTIPSVGSAEAQQIVQMRAQVTGELSAVHFIEGQEVKKGEELFTIDPRPFQAALSQAQAVLARDTATANNAQAQLKRYDDLYKRQLISRDVYEAQIATNDAAQATLEADRATVETARLNLQFTHIIAPITGRTGSLGVHQGDLIRANDTNPMVTINQLSPIYVVFAVPGRYLTDIRRYQARKPLTVHAKGQATLPPGAQPPPPPVLGSLQAAPPSGSQPGASAANPSTLEKTEASAGMSPAISESGHVTFIDNAVDSTTGTIRLKGTFDNADHALWPGQFLQITLDLTTEEGALVVPAGAVNPSQSGQFVYVVKPDRSVEVRNVVILRQQGEEVVIAQGLQPGEEVVTEGQLRLTPGAKVTGANGRGNPEEPAAAGSGTGSQRRGRRG